MAEQRLHHLQSSATHDLTGAAYLAPPEVDATDGPPVAAVGVDVCTLKDGLWSSGFGEMSSSGSGTGIGIVRR